MSRLKLATRINRALASYGKNLDPPTNSPGNQTVTTTLLKQASRGNASAQYRLACCYAAGDVVSRDKVTACRWFENAANAGYVPAMVRLGDAHLAGEGTERNRVRGLFWLLKASNRGSRDACARLGIHYLNGQELPKRKELAFKWLRQAANRGCVSSMLGLAHCYKHGIGIEYDLLKAYVAWTVATARSGTRLGSISKLHRMEGLTDEQIEQAYRLSAGMVNGPLDL